MKDRTKRSNRRWGILIAVLMIVMLFPFFLVLINSLKSMSEIGENVIHFPSTFRIENYTFAFRRMNFPRALANTCIITVLGNVGLVIFATMSGYWLCRKRSNFHRVVYLLLLGAMAVPFQATMIPFVKVMKQLNLSGNLYGISFAYWGMCCPTVIFLSEGAVKGIPIEIEESAAIDGCSPIRTFFSVVFPNLKNIVVTFTILNIFYMWNDYLLPFLMLGVNKKNYTIQIALKVFSGEYGIRWDYMLPGVILAMIVPLIIFVFCQNMIMEGMISGSVKG